MLSAHAQVASATACLLGAPIHGLHRACKASILLPHPKRSPFLSREPEQDENKRAQIAAEMGHTVAWVQCF